MLNHYSRVFGRVKFWLILSVPLAGFIIGTTFWFLLLPSLSSIFDEKAIPYTMMAFGGILTEGFLLGFAFVLVSRSMRKKGRHTLSEYLIVSAIGITILFVSFFANPSAGSYLPFGSPSTSFFGFGAYLFFAGVYFSASSITSDMSLRQTIRSHFWTNPNYWIILASPKSTSKLTLY